MDAAAHTSDADPGRAASPRLGTRFLVFPQPPYIPGYEKPEVVWLAPSAGGITAGPSDRRMYVADPLEAKRPYAYPILPPYAGALCPPVEPDADGHFDYITPDSPAFLATHSFACARRVLDIFEGYVGREIRWFFEPTLSRLEIIPHIADWDNAQSGFGFVEFGESEPARVTSRFALNFDSVAHEMGHLILLSELGLLEGDGAGSEFFAYHEAVADFASLLGLLHFDTAADRILRRTGGNLLINNELDRFASSATKGRSAPSTIRCARATSAMKCTIIPSHLPEGSSTAWSRSIRHCSSSEDCPTSILASSATCASNWRLNSSKRHCVRQGRTTS